jgi:hypothetical protein
MSLAEIQGEIHDWGKSSRVLIEVDATFKLLDADGSLATAVAQLYDANKHRDASCSVTVEDVKPKSFKALQSFQIHEMSRAMSRTAFWLAALFLLTIPYRVFFEARAGKVKLAYVKSVFGATVSTPQGVSDTSPGVTLGGGFPAGMGGGMRDMAQMQQQLAQNPEMMRQMMSMLQSNPQVRSS